MLGKPAKSSETLLLRFQCGLEFASQLQHVADSAVSDRKVTLRAAIVRALLGQPAAGCRVLA